MYFELDLCIECGKEDWHLILSFLGTVLDDIGNTGCVPLSQCPCKHNDKTYLPGESFNRHCESW